MWSLLFICFLSLILDARLQTEDQHLCLENVSVNYTVEEQTPLEEYGMFAGKFKTLGIKGTLHNITKTKLVPQKICCSGYEKVHSERENCQLIPTTPIPDDITTERLSQIYTNSSSNGNSSDNKSSNIILLICGLVLILITIIIILSITLWQKRNSKRRDIQESAHELEAHSTLLIN